MNERDILYKLFFDMKKDVTELKKMFFEIVQNPGAMNIPANYSGEHYFQEGQVIRHPEIQEAHALQPIVPAVQTPVIVPSAIQDHIEVEESLNILDKERELIIKALKKHKGKRKDAASDLGISERTLYRKLKEYNIEE